MAISDAGFRPATLKFILVFLSLVQKFGKLKTGLCELWEQYSAGAEILKVPFGLFLIQSLPIKLMENVIEN